MWMSRHAKSPYLTRQLSVFSDHRRVNLYLRVWLGWCARRTQGFILVRAERPNVQFTAARVTDTWFAVGVTNRRERERIPVSGGRSEQVLKARLPLSRVLVSCSCVCLFFRPQRGAPCFPFYRRRESAGYRRGKGEERERWKKASRVAGSFFSFMWVPLIL